MHWFLCAHSFTLPEGHSRCGRHTSFCQFAACSRFGGTFAPSMVWLLPYSSLLCLLSTVLYLAETRVLLLQNRLANAQAKFNLLPLFINKVLLQYNQAFVYVLLIAGFAPNSRVNSIVETETVWPTKPRLFTI